MKFSIAFVTLLYIIGVTFGYSGTGDKECKVECTNEYYPVCGMEVAIAKREFTNTCVLERENKCNGGRYVICYDIK